MATRSAERTDFLATVLVTAVEGGIGYWCEARNFWWDYDDDHKFTTASVEVREEEATAWRKVTLATIERGIRRVGSPDFEVNNEWRGWILAGSVTNDTGVIDSDAAETIVQAGLFGELVYG
jgi:hypothetical protein